MGLERRLNRHEWQRRFSKRRPRSWCGRIRRLWRQGHGYGRNVPTGLHSMRGPKTFTNYVFQVSAWGIILFAIGMIVAGSADMALNLRWGYSLKDVGMAVIVLLGTILVKVVGTKIISAVGGGL